MWPKSFEKALKYKLLTDYYQSRNQQKYQRYDRKYQHYLKHFVDEYEKKHGHLAVKKAGHVRFLHASTHENKDVDIYLNRKRVVKNLPFSGISKYLSLPEGEYTLQVFPAGRKDQELLRERLRVRRDHYYTVGIADEKRRTQGVDLLVYQDDVKPTAGRAKVRLIQLSADLPTIDVALKNNGVIFSNVRYTEARFITLPAGVVSFQIRTAKDHRTLYHVNNVRLQAGKVYSFFLIGKTKGKPAFRVLIAVDR